MVISPGQMFGVVAEPGGRRYDDEDIPWWGIALLAVLSTVMLFVEVAIWTGRHLRDWGRWFADEFAPGPNPDGFYDDEIGVFLEIAISPSRWHPVVWATIVGLVGWLWIVYGHPVWL